MGPDCCEDEYNDYYARQAGGALPYFAGAQYQRGHGLGNLFGSLLRSAMPLTKRGAVALGKGALKTGVRIAGDVLSGQNIKKAAKRRVTDAGRSMLRNLEIPGVRPRKRHIRRRWRSYIDSRAKGSRPSWISLPYTRLRTASSTAI